MKKRFVFRLNSKVYNEVAVAITSDAEILFEGDLSDIIPSNVQDLIDSQLAQDSVDADEKKVKEDAIKILLKDKSSSTKDRLDALIEHLGLDI